MNLINKEFTSNLDNRFLTENVSIFLYSLIKAVRPKKIIEVGAGYTTPFLCQAILDVRSENYDWISASGSFSENYREHSLDYNPTFTIVENYDHQYAIKQTKELLEYYSASHLVNFVEADAKDFVLNNSTEYDFVWMDFGSGEEYMFYFKEFYRTLPSGGYIIVHSTVNNKHGNKFVVDAEKMKEEMNFEMMTFVEPHKSIQSSWTIFKKKTEYKIYTEYA